MDRESLEVDVLYVGAGPATLASALHLSQEVKRLGLDQPSILVIEKAAEIGDHMLSGAVMNPKAIQELIPDFIEQGFPTEYICNKDMTYFFSPKRKLRSPINPPFFKKKGYHVISLSNVAKWLASRCEEAGIDIYPGFAGDKLLTKDGHVLGVRTGDMGVSKEGKAKGTFQPGMDILAKVTVLGEGVRGTLTKQLLEEFDLHGCLLYTSPSPRDGLLSRMPSSA